MKTLQKLIEKLTALEAVLIRRKASNRAARVAFRMALNGCRL